jgi:hypothetical protein
MCEYSEVKQENRRFGEDLNSNIYNLKSVKHPKAVRLGSSMEVEHLPGIRVCNVQG